MTVGKQLGILDYDWNNGINVSDVIFGKTTDNLKLNVIL